MKTTLNTYGRGKASLQSTLERPLRTLLLLEDINIDLMPLKSRHTSNNLRIDRHTSWCAWRADTVKNRAITAVLFLYFMFFIAMVWILSEVSGKVGWCSLLLSGGRDVTSVTVHVTIFSWHTVHVGNAGVWLGKILHYNIGVTISSWAWHWQRT
jgi:hypothetical protein